MLFTMILVGVILVLSGVWWIFPPAALILLGLGTIVVCYGHHRQLQSRQIAPNQERNSP